MNPTRQSVLFRQAAACLCAAVMFCAASNAQEPALVVEVDRQEVYLGESIVYQVTVNHVENPTPPDLSSFRDFQIDSLGQQSLNSRQITIINGRRSEVVRQGMQFRYRLTPTKAGQSTIPAPTTSVDGKVLTGREVPINVVAPSDQDIAILQLSCDRESVYVMQPFTLTLQVLVKELPTAVADQSPLSVQGDDPVKLSIPWIDDDQLPKGLRPQQPWQELMRPLMQTTRRGFRESPDGFQINNIGSSSVSFFGRETTVFKPDPERLTQNDAEGNPQAYLKYVFQRTLMATKPGSYHLGPVNLKGTFGTKLKDGQLTGQQIYAVAESIALEAKSPPLNSRPESYIGVIGENFAAEASLAPTSARVGDPMTLTVKVTGTGLIDDAVAPDINSIPGMDSLFRTYDATSASEQDAKIFTYSLRPLGIDVNEFPPIPLAYFDPNQEKYVAVETAAIPVSIEAARGKVSDDDIVTSGPKTPANSILRASQSGLFANHSSLQSLRATNVALQRWVGLWAMMIVGYVAASFGIRRHQRLHSDPTHLRRKNARSRAAARMKALGVNDKNALETMNKTVAGLIADFTGTAEAGMTSHDAVQHLAGAGVSDALRQRTQQFMDQCDAARYGATNKSSSELLQDGQQLVSDLGKELERQC